MTVVNLQPNAASGKDTYIDAGAQTTNYGTNTGLVVAGPASTKKALLEFDLSSIPTDAVINSATLRLRAYAAPGNTVSLHRGLVAWVEGQATWQERATSTPWAGGNGGAAGSDYATSASDSNVVNASSDWDFDVTSDVDDIVTAAGANYGWWLIQGSGVSTGFYSSDYGTAGDRPELIIDYTPSANISGTAAGTSTASAWLVSTIMSGIAAGTSTAVANLISRLEASGTAEGTSSASAHAVGTRSRGGSAAGTSTATATATRAGIMRGSASGSSTATASMWGYAKHVRPPYLRNSAPVLYLSDGLTKFDLLNYMLGYCLESWKPSLAQYKSGGQWANSPLADGRHLIQRVFDNAYEVMRLNATGKDQDELIRYTNDLLRWKEAAADYWTNRWSDRPIYIGARSAYELNERFAIIHIMSIPELDEVYDQSFAARRPSPGRPSFNNLTLRIERGPWRDVVPGQSTCVPISAIRSWTVSGWESGA